MIWHDLIFNQILSLTCVFFLWYSLEVLPKACYLSVLHWVMASFLYLWCYCFMVSYYSDYYSSSAWISNRFNYFPLSINFLCFYNKNLPLTHSQSLLDHRILICFFSRDIRKVRPPLPATPSLCFYCETEFTLFPIYFCLKTLDKSLFHLLLDFIDNLNWRHLPFSMFPVSSCNSNPV